MTALHIAIAKPHYGIRGGFERVVDRVADHLGRAGHRVTWLTVNGSRPSSRIHGVDVPQEVLVHAYEYFRYMSVLERFDALDAGCADVVLCTQPGSWAVRHPRKLALFYHHHRVFYDLADRYAGAGFVDAGEHAAATEEVRATDTPLLDGVTHFLVPSTEVSGRLELFNAVPEARRSPFLAGCSLLPRTTGRDRLPPESDPRPFALCVSRHEWPKRTELAVAAAHHLRTLSVADPVEVVLAGDGGRIDHIRALDRRMVQDGVGEEAEAIWDAPAFSDPPSGRPLSPNLGVLGPVTATHLAQLYAGALCVLAPAFREDYGLTAVEAMAHGRPVVVCRDGGGLLDTVRHGENGLVVEPHGRAIADGVEMLRDDSRLWAHLSAGAVATAAAYTWDRAMAQLDDGLEQALG